MIGVIKTNYSNFQSLTNALDFLKIQWREIKKVKDFKIVTHIILPGVGSFRSVINALQKKKLINYLKKEILIKKKPFLGICLGMQILCDYGWEDGKHKGLGIVKGECIKIPNAKDFKVPNIGWCDLNIKKKDKLFKNISNSTVYFVHSFYLKVDKKIITSTLKEKNKITASICKKNIYGVQFHPEKSQLAGLQILKNFSKINKV
jgi:glutamine amidotransferase